MPALPNEKIRIETKTNGCVTHEAKVSVSTSGMFSVSLPDDIRETVIAFHDKSRYTSNLGVHSSAGKMRVQGPTLKACIDFVKLAMANHYAVETTTECFLVYKYSSGFSYWKNPDGTITHNGGAGDADRVNGHWAGSLANDRLSSREDDKVNGLILSAWAMVKTVHSRGENKTTEWDVWRPTDHMDDSALPNNPTLPEKVVDTRSNYSPLVGLGENQTHNSSFSFSSTGGQPVNARGVLMGGRRTENARTQQ